MSNLPIKSADLSPPDTTFDKILGWFLDTTGKCNLSVKNTALRQRWECAYDLQCNYKTPTMAAPILMRKYNLSRAQAYRDIKNATNLFGDINATRKEGSRHVLYEYAMKTLQMASRDRNVKEMNKAVGNMIKIKGLDREDPNIPDFSRLEPTTQVIQLNPEFLEQYGHLIDKKVMTKMRKVIEKNVFDEYRDIIDISHEEVKDA